MMKKCTIILFSVVVMAISSCQRIHLYDEGDGLLVVVDIDADVPNMESEPNPELMYVGFFYSDTKNNYTVGYIPSTRGEVNAVPNTYDVLAYNFDTESTMLRNTNKLLDTEAYTSQAPISVQRSFQQVGSSLAQARNEDADSVTAQSNSSETRSYEDEDIIYPPDYLFVGVLYNVEVPYHDAESPYQIDISASTVVDTYRLVIGEVEGMEYVTQADVFVTGQVESLKIAQREVTGEPSTLYFNFDPNANPDYFDTTFNTFGKYPDDDRPVYVVLKVLDSSDTEWYYEWDVTDQMTDANNTQHLIYINEKMKFKGKEVGGMSPSANQWEEEITDIDI